MHRYRYSVVQTEENIVRTIFSGLGIVVRQKAVERELTDLLEKRVDCACGIQRVSHVI